MRSINTHVGKMIRKYRKAANLTLQQLADAIHKSRATICKYENGDISMDIETLYEISQVLQVSVPQLTDIGRLQAEAEPYERWCNQYPRKRREWQLPCDAFYLFRIREWKKQ